MSTDSRAIEDRGPVVLAVTTAMIGTSTLFVFLRLVSRAGIVKKISTDDYVMFLAWVIAFALSFTICYATRFGLGKHERDVLDELRTQLEKLEYTFTALYNPALMATKTSILIFYLSLAKGQKVFRWTSVGTLVVVNVAGLALSLLNIFQCRPLSTLFDEPKPASADCTEIVTLYLSSAPVNIITDLIILLLPIPVLKAMRLPKKQKLILHITFGFGVFVTAVDVVRIGYLQQAAETRLNQVLNGQENTNNAKNQEASDFSWFAAYIFLWSAIEVNVGIMCACVPGLKPLVTRFMPHLIRDAVNSSTEKKDSNHAIDFAALAAAQRVPSMPLRPAMASHCTGRGDPDPNDLNFMTTPDMDDIPRQVERSQTAMTNTSALSRRPSLGFLDFMNVRDMKPIVYMSAKESIRPIAEVTVLFFLWGFAYGLLNSLNSQIQQASHESSSQAIGTHSAYYVGYFCAPLTLGQYVFKHWGFKACYMVGLMIYGTGTLVFWPSAVLTSWPGFLVTNWLIGLGLSILEMAGNPFIALCGPPEYAEMRLSLSQGFQAIGTLVAHTLAEKALFKSVSDAPSLIDVQWTYLAISLFTYILAFIYHVVKLPEVTDSEMEDAAEQCHPQTLTKLRKSHIIWVTLGMGAFAQFCYVGGQESVATSLSQYISETSPGSDITNYEVIGLALFAASRFLSAGASYIITPRLQILFFFAGAVIFSALAMNFSGLTAGVMVMCVFFFEGPLFPLIFANPLRGLGRHTRIGSAVITTVISGGAIFPGIMHALINSRAEGVQYAFCIVVAAFAFGALFPIYLWIVPLARAQTHPLQRHAESENHPRATMAAFASKAKALGHLTGAGKRSSDLSTVAAHSTGSVGGGGDCETASDGER